LSMFFIKGGSIGIPLRRWFGADWARMYKD
jgi:hypothetical protein